MAQWVIKRGTKLRNKVSKRIRLEGVGFEEGQNPS